MACPSFQYGLVGSLLLMLLLAFSVHANQSPQQSIEVLWQKALRQSLMSDSARICLEEIIQIASSLGERDFEAEGHYLLGKHYFLMMQDDFARVHFHQARAHFSQLRNWEKAGYSNVQLGLSFNQTNQLDSALLSFQAAIQLYRAHDLLQHLWTPYMGISLVYKMEGRVSAAFQYGWLAIEALRHTSDRTGKVIALKHMLKLARENDSLQIYTSVSDQLLTLYSPLEMDSRVIQHINHFAEIEDPQSRVVAILGAIGQLEKWPVMLELVSSYYQLGNAHAEMKNIPSAIESWKKAYALERDQLKDVHFAPALLRALGSLYENQGQFDRALGYIKQYHALKDSLQEEYAKAKTEELTLQFETAAKDQQIAAQQLTVARHTFQRNVILGVIVFLLISGGYVFFTQRRHLRDQTTITNQQEALHHNEIHHLRKQHEVANLQTLITAQEEERRRIAQDLHDSLGGLIATLRIKARKNTLQASESVSTHQDEMQLIDTVSAEVRRIAHNMMPPALIRMGLSAALEDLVDAMQGDSRLQISYQNIDYDHSLEQDKEITLYRIAQELCTNVVKHAQAEHMLIQLSRHNGTAVLVVEDDGKGYDSTLSGKGMGLDSIRSRVEYLNGEMEILTSPGNGTSTTINVPVL